MSRNINKIRKFQKDEQPSHAKQNPRRHFQNCKNSRQIFELAKGHDDALAWCRDLQRLKLEEVGLDIDDLEDYSHLYGDSTDEESGTTLIRHQ